MLTPLRNISYTKPDTFIGDGSGDCFYHYDIQSEEITLPKEKDKEEKEVITRYSFIRIRTKGKPTYKACVESIIRQYITQSQEFDLINTANKAIINKEEVPESYKEYLELLDVIKANVKKDFSN